MEQNRAFRNSHKQKQTNRQLILNKDTKDIEGGNKRFF